MKRLLRLALLLAVVVSASFLLYSVARNGASAAVDPVPERAADSLHRGLDIIATNNGIDVRVISAEFTSYRTLLTLEMKHPTISEDVSAEPLFLPIRDEDIWLDGLAGSSIKARARTIARSGREQVRLELSPVLKPGTTVVFEITQLNVRRTNGGFEPAVGPWRFELASPATIGIPPVRQQVNQQVESSSVQNALDAVEISNNETTLYYRTNFLLTGEVSSIGLPVKLRLPDGSLLQGKHRSDNSGHGEPSVMSFPSLPKNTNRFNVEFGPYLVATQQAVAFALPLPVKASELPVGTRLVLDHSIVVGPSEYRPMLGLGDKGFTIAFEPLNDAAKSSFIGGPGARLNLTDDVGAVYVHRATDTNISADNVSVLQKFTFDGNISPDARELRLQVPATGEILKGPWSFEVAIPR